MSDSYRDAWISEMWQPCRERSREERAVDTARSVMGLWENESEAAKVRQHPAASDPPSSAKTRKGADGHHAIGL